MLNASPPTVYDSYLLPILELLPHCSHLRSCPQLSDQSWLRLGLERILQEPRTGRGFLQTHGPRLDFCPENSHYFATLRSPRRLWLLEELNNLHQSKLREVLPDQLAVFPQLDNFEIFAGDGHWHGAAAHDPRPEGTRCAVGHFYSLDLRRGALRRLTTAEGKKEHDIHALKRQPDDTLRQGTPKGRQVIYVWDKASIDFRYWYRLKAKAGIYFISLEKENMKLEPMGSMPLDSSQALNAGVLRDELVGSSNGVTLRRITYQVPDTGEILVFLSNELTLPPGLIAHLYWRRWRIEKVFDIFKNKLGESKAWASSATAKAMQAELLCLTHNLNRCVEHKLATQEKLINEPDRKRRSQRLAKQKQLAQEAKRPWPSTWETLQEPVQYSVKLVRWLRSCFVSGLLWDAALLLLRALYAKL